MTKLILNLEIDIIFGSYDVLDVLDSEKWINDETYILKYETYMYAYIFSKNASLLISSNDFKNNSEKMSYEKYLNIRKKEL